MGALDFADHPFPERERLGVRIVDTEDAHTLPDPEFDDALEFVPQLLPGFAFEIERIDVLVFFRRVLGVLHAAVGTPAKPLGMLLHIRMIRRALEGDVEGDLQVELAGCAHEPAEILERAELG